MSTKRRKQSRSPHGQGSTRKRKDGRWEGLIDFGGLVPVVDRDGAFVRHPETGLVKLRRDRKSVYGASEKEVIKKMADEVKKHEKNRIGSSSSEPVTVQKFLSDWLKGYKSQVRPRTWERYAQFIEIHAAPGIGHLGLEQLEARHLRALYTDREAAGLSPTSITQMHRIIRKALSQAVGDGVLPRNVADSVSPPKMVRRKMSTLSPVQARLLLTNAKGTRLEAMFVLALSTGMRLGELSGLRWSNVDLEHSRLQVVESMQRSKMNGLVSSEVKTKGSRRSIRLTARAVESLRQHRIRQATERLAMGPRWNDLDLVFPNTVGKPMEGQAVLNRHLRPLLEKAGLPLIRFHDLRHTCATLLLGKGVHPKIVSEMLGHSQVSITLDLYSHVTPTMQEAAAAALDDVLGDEGDVDGADSAGAGDVDDQAV